MSPEMPQSTNKRLLIIGFGNQAKAWAHNLHDSGWEITIALRERSSSQPLVDKSLFPVLSIENLHAQENLPTLVALLTPDETHLSLLKNLENHLGPKTCIVYAHGHSFSRHKFNEVFPQWQHLLLAPKSIASELRRRYLQREPLGAVYDVRGDHKLDSENEVKSLAKDLGITFGPHKSSFEEETKADLFSEQTLLCSLLPYGAKLSYEKLIEKGVSSETAFLECWVEMKLIVDTMLKKGPKEFFNMISPTAFIGGQKAQKLLLDEDFQKKIESLWSDINSGQFDRELEECELKELRKDVELEWENSPLNKAHEKWGKEFFGSDFGSER